MTAEAEIRRRIAARGAITFAEFMELALYHPQSGYYTSGERIGASGDYYTSPAVHPAFGAMLAVQLLQMWQLLSRPSSFTVVEAGAGNGLLCRDINSIATGLDVDFARSLRYVCVDRRTSVGLEADVEGATRITSSGLPVRGVVGCVLSNELLDAMPVHQVAVQDGELREVYVTLDDEALAKNLAAPSTLLLAERLEGMDIRLAEGQVAEINLGLGPWVCEAAAVLERGFVLTIDYGRTAEDLYSATERFRGTLTTLHNHVQTDRPLERIGRQDMSAQVDFTSLERAGARKGLKTLGYTTQAEFLDNLELNRLLQRLFGDPQGKTQSSRMGMRELVKRGGLGDFKVMAQGKNVMRPALWGFNRSEEPAALVERIPLPVPTGDHIDLRAGRYPSMDGEFEVAWDTFWPDDSSSP